MKLPLSVFSLFLFLSCSPTKKMEWTKNDSKITGSGFYAKAASMNWSSRDSFAVDEILKGHIPGFLRTFEPVYVTLFDSINLKKVHVTYYVSPDYISIGTDDDWARVPLTPMASQRIADQLECILPTRKMVNDIHENAKLRLEPVPMFAFRDSTPTMWHHHLIIEGQRKGRNGLISGIKKDIVTTARLNAPDKSNKVAIYGWHKLDGKPIQPLYTGHVNWYVDYSHGTRLVYKRVKVNGRWMYYSDVMYDPVLKKLLCDEEDCTVFRYAGKE